MSVSPTAIFVYGTLQRGQCRERCWPRPPLRIELATVQGALYDLGPYPALVAGEDAISGELWHLSPEDVQVTLAALDQVEAFATQPDDLYRREVVTCQTAGGAVEAWAYHYARREDLKSFQRVYPDAAGQCRWTKLSAG